MENPELGDGSVTMTAYPSRAYVFTIMESVTHSSYSDDYMATVDWRSFVYNISISGSLVFASVDYKTSDYAWLCSSGSGVFTWTQYVNTTAWMVYEVVENSAYDNLYSVLQQYFSSSTPEDMFTAGTTPGHVDADLLQTLQTAYEAAQEMVNNFDATEEEYQAAADNVYNAYVAVRESIVPVTEGYYIITNKSTASDQAYGRAVIYDTGSALGWYEYVYSDSTGLAAENADCVWQLIPVEGTDGGYYIRNYSTGRYMGSQTTTNTAVPTDATASQIYYVDYQSGTAFVIYTTNQNNSYPCLHAQGVNSGTRVMIWTASANASGWYFTEITSDVLAGIEEEIEQIQRNTAAEELLQDARVLINKGITLQSDVTYDGLYDDNIPGLVTEQSRFFTNAKEPTGADTFDGLIDNDQTTLFHSAWSISSTASLIHYLGADLGKEVQYFDIKYSRRNTLGNGTPYIIHVYACNDTLDNAANNDYWTDQGYYTLSYDYEANDTYTTPGTANFTGVKSIALDAPYRFVRFDVEHTITDATTNGNIYFFWTELRFYEGTYDAENSLVEAVPDDIYAALKEQISTVNAILAADGDVSQEQYDALKAAYDAYEAAFPDIDAVNELYAECQAQLEAAVEGTELGYFAEGSKAVFQAALEEIATSIKTVMTAEEIETCIAALSSAFSTFNASLIVPEDGDVLRIRSASSSTDDGTPYRNFIYAQNNDESQVLWGGYDVDNGGNDEFLETRLNYLWKVIKHDDGTISLQNLGTGTYLGNPGESGEDVNMSLEADNVEFRSAKYPGLFNIAFADGVYAYMNTSGELVSTNSTSAQDNASLELLSVSSWDQSYHYDLSATAQVITLPFAIYATPADGNLYKVLGRSSSTVELTQYAETDEIPAATPFVYIPLEGVTATSTDFYPTAGSLDELEFDLTPKTDNGLVGVLASQIIKAGQGIIYNGVVTISGANEEVAANSGYFTDAVPVTDATGDATLTLEGVINSIGSLAVLSNENVSVYTLSGVKVREGVKAANATSGLPKGLYIVGGSKVLVK